MAANPEGGAVKIVRSNRRVVWIVAVLLCSLFVYRPGANGLRKRIVSAIGLALGHKVDVDWVRVRLLPQPAFELDNFVVHDDPVFSAEPMLRAQEVTAAVRLRSLLRGRLEIGRLSLKEPSINLVRSHDGHWNLESLLERAAHTPAAPTSHTHPEAHPVFPYIEADNGRINFKVGPEKKAYALTEADFALWLESENQWGMRLAAVPVRTDFNLKDTGDTGTLRVNGTWLRSGSLRDTPLTFTLEWDRAQLGQFTKLIYGTDKGWRGGITLSTSFTGTPADLSVKAQASIQDFRRYDIVPPQTFRLSTTCTAHYSSRNHRLSEIICLSPVGDGAIRLGGTIGAPTGPRTYDLDLLAQDVPIASMVALAERAKRDLPSDLIADGVLNADFSLRTQSNSGKTSLVWAGKGETTEFRLASRTSKAELNPGKLAFELVSGPALAKSGKNRHPHLEALPGPYLVLGRFPLPLGKSSSTSLEGWIGASGYHFSLEGDAQVERVLQAAQITGVKAPALRAEGLAKLNLEIAGPWADFAGPQVLGSAQLRSLRVEFQDVGSPLEIASANLFLSDREVRVLNLSASAAGSRWTGSMTFPLPSSAKAASQASFDLETDNISFNRLDEWLHPKARKRPWYRFSSPEGQSLGPSLFVSAHAAGRLRANQVAINDLVASQVSANVELDDGHVRLSGMKAQLLGGKYQADWDANLRATPPIYTGTGTFSAISLSELASVMQDGWITGVGDGSYRLITSGRTSAQLLSAATGALEFELHAGLLPHIALASGSEALRIRRFTGRLVLRNGRLEIQEGELDTPEGIYLVSGSASLERNLDVRFARGGTHGYNVTGTLSEPHVLAADAPQAQAILKP